MSHQRTRIRFAKLGDLRMISHRDLVRLFERLFRRVGVSLAMSQGFHPRPLMTFPDALALGIEALDEVMDITLAETIDPVQFQRQLSASAPEGLAIHSVRILGDNERKAKLDKVVYEMAIPDRIERKQLRNAIQTFVGRDVLQVTRKGERIELDLKETLDGLWLDDDRLVMTIRVVQRSQLQPRDILEALGLHEAIQEGTALTRTRIELST